MTTLTIKESEALLILFKDISQYYNANSISKQLGISRVGAMKLLKKLLKENIAQSQKIGKSTVYKPNLGDEYVRKLIVFLLADEAHQFKRWNEEFKELFEGERIILLFGSAVKNYAAAQDIDIMIVTKKGDVKVRAIVKEKEQLLPKKLHAIILTAEDLHENIKNKNKATVDIIKNAIVLYGQDKYMEILKNVTGF
ncbi:MAG: nucleotidyltransferase domain-containing protein [Atribacterota bacterium]|nr:nucleotidyltransferase domain-containing protein [Atribacterota bacterium]